MAIQRKRSLLARIVETNTPALSLDEARTFLSWNFSDDHQNRLALLATKANSGTLTADEQAEFEEYYHVNDFLTVLHSRADHALHPEKYIT